ncbi:MAG: hypothetical protein WA982_01120 [Rubrobacteraceae bacterium]
MRRLSFLLAMTMTIFSCTIFLAPDRAYACSCAFEAGVTKQERVQEAFSQANAVFAGKVVDLEDPPSPVSSSMDPITATFDVSEAWKGSQAKTQKITTPLSEASCGYEFQAGKAYLVYASEDMEVLLCGETKPLSEAKVDLETLGTIDVLPDTSGVAGPRYLVPYSVVGASGLATVLATLALVISRKSSRRT